MVMVDGMDGSKAESGGLCTLSSLAVGQSARIASLRASTPFELRLLELGFVPGSTVTVRRSSPLQDPVEYEVRQNRICLRKSEAARIMVERPTLPL